MVALVAVGAVAGALVIEGAKFCLEFPRDDGLLMFVSASCPHSNDLEEQLVDRPELLEHLVVLPAQVGNPAWRDAWCSHALNSIDGLGAAIVYLVPSSVSCAWVESSAVRYYDANFTYTPAWSRGARRIDPAQRSQVLAEIGLVLDPTNELRLVDDPPRRTNSGSRPRENGDDPMRWGTGHTVGM